MSLYAYNKTTAPLLLAASNTPVTLPAAATTGDLGPAYNVTSELRGLAPADYAALQAQVAAGSVYYQWAVAPEYQVGTLYVGFADLNFYADAVSGSDSNSGTQASPFKTWDRIVDAVPSGYKGLCFLNFAAGTYGITRTATNLRTVRFSGNNGQLATPVLFVGTMNNVLGTFNPNANQNITSTGRATVTATFPGVTANQFRGSFIKCITGSGSNANRMRMIVSNTASDGSNNVTFNLNFPMTANLATTDTWQVQAPAAIFNVSGPLLFSGGGNRIGHIGVKYTFAAGAVLASEDYTSLAFAACQIDGTSSAGINFVHGTQLFFEGDDGGGQWGGFAATSSPFQAITGNQTPAGLYVKSATMQLGGSRLQGNIVADTVLFTNSANPENEIHANLNVPNMLNCTVRMIAPSTFLTTGPQISGSTTVRGLFDGSIGATQPAVWFDGRTYATLSGFDVQNCTGNCIRVLGGSYVVANDIGNGPAANNSLFGFQLDGKSNVIYKTTATATSVTGTSGDVSLGGQAVSYANITAAGGMVDPYGNFIEPQTNP